ncbi:Protein dehydration-induced 19-like 4 [Vitis vinifera]|uniref:Protein dehydration-induced 19-like 4 n=1 Tax=Vitis vinifera TaxID=29760 RepID=A0A438DRS2_VITVI|nr:Protein dehydration-induced 19-like 4 [Vitis vinifera]
MNTDFWASRLAAAKRQYALQHHHNSSQLDRLSIDDFEVEDEARPDFPCPYCYEDYDIASLCSHLEDEHSCESRVTVRGLDTTVHIMFMGVLYLLSFGRVVDSIWKSYMVRCYFGNAHKWLKKRVSIEQLWLEVRKDRSRLTSVKSMSAQLPLTCKLECEIIEQPGMLKSLSYKLEGGDNGECRISKMST